MLKNKPSTGSFLESESWIMNVCVPHLSYLGLILHLTCWYVLHYRFDWSNMFILADRKTSPSECCTPPNLPWASAEAALVVSIDQKSNVNNRRIPKTEGYGKKSIWLFTGEKMNRAQPYSKPIVSMVYSKWPKASTCMEDYIICPSNWPLHGMGPWFSQQ